MVLDAQVVNDQLDLDFEHEQKSDLYKNDAIRDWVKKKTDCQEVSFSSITLS